jgi:hypothetical protein
MPCHVDAPTLSNDDYHKILLLEAIKLLPNIIVTAYEVPLIKYVLSPSSTIESLCRACKYLTKEQIKGVDGPDGYVGLFTFYCEHLLKDYINNSDHPEEQKIAEKELKRIGIEIFIEYGFIGIRGKGIITTMMGKIKDNA